MLAVKRQQDTSGNPAKYGDIYQFYLADFWGGQWIQGRLFQKTDSELIQLTKREYLSISSEIPESGCVLMNVRSHAALYKLLLSRSYLHFGITGIKTLYLIMCIEGFR
jgi:hypothetical protein